MLLEDCIHCLGRVECLRTRDQPSAVHHAAAYFRVDARRALVAGHDGPHLRPMFSKEVRSLTAIGEAILGGVHGPVQSRLLEQRRPEFLGLLEVANVERQPHAMRDLGNPTPLEKLTPQRLDYWTRPSGADGQLITGSVLRLREEP